MTLTGRPSSRTAAQKAKARTLSAAVGRVLVIAANKLSDETVSLAIVTAEMPNPQSACGNDAVTGRTHDSRARHRSGRRVVPREHAIAAVAGGVKDGQGSWASAAGGTTGNNIPHHKITNLSTNVGSIHNV